MFFFPSKQNLIPIWGVLTLCLKFVSFPIYSTSKTVPLVSTDDLLNSDWSWCHSCTVCHIALLLLFVPPINSERNIQLAFCCLRRGCWCIEAGNEHVVWEVDCIPPNKAAHLRDLKSSLFYHRWKGNKIPNGNLFCKPPGISKHTYCYFLYILNPLHLMAVYANPYAVTFIQLVSLCWHLLKFTCSTHNHSITTFYTRQL